MHSRTVGGGDIWKDFAMRNETEGRGREEDSRWATMATADSAVKPLQNAMKMAKLAIQLDGGNKHKVVCHRAGPQS